MLRSAAIALLLLAASCGGEDLCAAEPIQLVPWSGGTVEGNHFECSQPFLLCSNVGVSALAFPDSYDPANTVRVELGRQFESDGLVFVRFDLAPDRTVTAAAAAFRAGDRIYLPTSGRVSIEGNRIATDCVRGRLELTFESLVVEGEFAASCPDSDVPATANE